MDDAQNKTNGAKPAEDPTPQPGQPQQEQSGTGGGFGPRTGPTQHTEERQSTN
ncbi:MAG TPA: hypothetical protein VG317_09940 [Pseudonocardiaceae bacterium]|nr:hypothetical protein [Pseudonocardiaceae bacterium]